MEAVAAAAVADAVGVWLSASAEPVRFAAQESFATGAQEIAAERDTLLSALGVLQQQVRLKTVTRALALQSAWPASPRGRLARLEAAVLSSSSSGSDFLWNCSCRERYVASASLH